MPDVTVRIWVGVPAVGCIGLLALTLRRVTEAQAIVVERNGRFSRVLPPGPHSLLPPFDHIRNRIDLREQVVPSDGGGKPGHRVERLPRNTAART
ncbi:SPFH domain-containing protein [Streptomyces sp. NPDC058757]|uniref:SPFH domain-containing protein n=1 Tax=Streptomyces sp. NPDC058757 TaxID=3346626 RepID=UPI00369C10AC